MILWSFLVLIYAVTLLRGQDSFSIPQEVNDYCDARCSRRNGNLPSLPGPKGRVGKAGPKGEKGSCGQKGDDGIVGLQGEKGTLGQKGDKGALGQKGSSGISGLKGDKGFSGPKGVVGIPGTKGQKGYQGYAGSKGQKGSMGNKGFSGPKGIAGTQGPIGEKGISGPKGIAGIPGSKGQMGISGPKGSSGSKGARGLQSVIDYGAINETIKRTVDEAIKQRMRESAARSASNGWMVFQRREDGSVSFDRTWLEYVHGFGNKDEEFWIGLATLYHLTNKWNCELRIDLQDINGNTRYAEYSSFSVGSEYYNYKLFVSGYHGTAGDSLRSTHNGMYFSTKDNDNDESSGNCAQYHNSGWWFNSCYDANLNEVYSSRITWSTFTSGLKFVEMKIRLRQ